MFGYHMRPYRIVAGITAAGVVLLAGCQALTPTASMTPQGKAVAQAERLGLKAWIAPVAIPCLKADRRRDLEPRATESVVEAVRNRRVFREVRTLPEADVAVAPNDVILNYRFDRYTVNLGIHEAYFPVAILTATLYIWFGGPMVFDAAHFEATLTARSGSGETIAEVTAQKRYRENYSLYRAHKASILRTGYQKPAAARGELANDLLNRALPEIRTYASTHNL